MSSCGPLLVGIVSHSYTKVFTAFGCYCWSFSYQSTVRYWLILLVILLSKYGHLVVDIVGHSLIKVWTVSG